MALSVKRKCSSCFAINQPLLERACTDIHGNSWKLRSGQWEAEAMLQGSRVNAGIFMLWSTTRV